MAIFKDETKEEKTINQLLKNIKSSDLNLEWKEYLTNYLNSILNNQKNNDFYDLDFLRRIIIELLDNPYINDYSPSNLFEEIIKNLNMVFANGMYTPNYNELKEIFINNYCGYNGYIAKGLINNNTYSFKSLFSNVSDFYLIMNIIKDKEEYITKFNDINRFASEIIMYCPDDVTFKNILISFINGISFNLDKFDEYYAEKKSKVEKMCGIYNLDEKSISKISLEIERLHGLIIKLNNIEKRVSKYQETVEELTDNGKKTIELSINDGKSEIGFISRNASNELNQYLLVAKEEIKKQLDDYLSLLEQNLKKDSDEVFNDILNESRVEVEKIKSLITLLSSNTTNDLLRIKKASEKSVEELKRYVTEEPELQKLLAKASEQSQVKAAILNMTNSDGSIIVPDSTKQIVVPNIVVANEDVNREFLPLLDESVPFETRLAKVKEKIQEMTESGEIFHQKTLEVITCLMEGDWPYLWGPSGCGKTHTAIQLAQILGMDLADNGKVTEPWSVNGYDNANGNFMVTQAYLAAKYGKLLFLDELDNGMADTVVELGKLFSASRDAIRHPQIMRYAKFGSNTIIPVNPNFRMLATGNTKGLGADKEFTERNKFDESDLQRLIHIKFDYDNKIEEKIFGDYKSWFTFFADFRNACSEYAKKNSYSSVQGITTTRDADDIVKYINNNSKSVDEIMRHKFIQIKSKEYLRYLRDYFKKVYDIDSISSAPTCNHVLKNNDTNTLVRRFIYNCNEEINS